MGRERDDPAIEALSFTNTVHFYRDELTQIMKGIPATEILERYERQRLAKLGVLIVARGGAREIKVPWPVQVLMERLKTR